MKYLDRYCYENHTTGTMSVLTFDKVCKKFSSPAQADEDDLQKLEIFALSEISFRLEENETLALTGPSGSGKSTLLNLAAGLERPTSGEIYMFDQSLANLSENELARLRGSNIGFVFQSFRLLGSLTALENIELPAKLNSTETSFSDIGQKAKDLLYAVGLEKRAHHYPSQLSGGEQQRIALARAFSGSPKIILADEPTGNLDHETALRIHDLIFSMVTQYKISLLVATHDLRLAERASRSISLLTNKVKPDQSALIEKGL